MLRFDLKNLASRSHGKSMVPARRAASGMMAERIAALVVFLTSSPRYRHEVVKYCRDNWDVSPRMASNYYSRALKMIRDEHPLDRAAMTVDALARLDRMLNTNICARDRIRAEELRANIAGYLAPKQVEVAQFHVTAGRSQAQVDWGAVKQIACAAQGVALPALPEPAAPTLEIASVTQDGPTVPTAAPVQSVAAYGEPKIIDVDQVPPVSPNP